MTMARATTHAKKILYLRSSLSVVRAKQQKPRIYTFIFINSYSSVSKIRTLNLNQRKRGFNTANGNYEPRVRAHFL